MGEKHITRSVIAAAVSLALGCGTFVSRASAQSLTDRFKSLFGGKPDEPAQATPSAPADGEADMSCPPVSIRPGASTLAVAVQGKQAVGNDVRYQATITKTPPDCTRTGGDIPARVRLQGRAIAGPARAPSSVDLPIPIPRVQAP